MPAQLLPFLAVVAVLTLTPGPDMALVLRNGVRGGVTSAWWTGLGCCAGIAVYATAAAVGLAAVLAASATAFMVLKLVGAGYLIYLGVMALWHSRKGPAATPTETPVPTALGRRAAFQQGLVSNLLNPKIALIFLTLPHSSSRPVSPSRPPPSWQPSSSAWPSCGGGCSPSLWVRSAKCCPASGSPPRSNGSPAQCSSRWAYA
ncbi:LysE family translocator [Modestobacter muralis]|uniref:LysE family translocator n=1 Tax=Modestobacter muralis TaxID=1608614 RepID=UPI001B8D10B3|nr:LysE family translocator [Modestobacter muralis]